MGNNAKAGPIISHARLREIYGMVVRLSAAAESFRELFEEESLPRRRVPFLAHPAMLAGCLSHLRAGDLLSPSPYATAANLLAGAPLQNVVRAALESANAKGARSEHALPPAEAVAVLAGRAQSVADNNVILAFAAESALLVPSANNILHWIAEHTLPLVLVTQSRAMPQPGESQSETGIQQIAVGGDDVVAVYRVAHESLNRARARIGPTWIRCVFTNDTQFRNSGRAAAENMQQFLQSRGLFDPMQQSREQARWQREWDRARQRKQGNSSTGSVQPLPIGSFDLD